jgi:NAD(P)H-dependent FMN reductase
MPEKPFQLVVIVGSVREDQLGPTVADWFAGQARQREDLNVDVIDLADIDLPMVLPDLRTPVRCHKSSTASDLAFYPQHSCSYASCTC